MISIKCPNCQTVFDADLQSSSGAIKCAGCGKKLRIGSKSSSIPVASPAFTSQYQTSTNNADSNDADDISEVISGWSNNEDINQNKQQIAYEFGGLDRPFSFSESQEKSEPWFYSFLRFYAYINIVMGTIGFVLLILLLIVGLVFALRGTPANSAFAMFISSYFLFLVMSLLSIFMAALAQACLLLLFVDIARSFRRIRNIDRSLQALVHREH